MTTSTDSANSAIAAAAAGSAGSAPEAASAGSADSAPEATSAGSPGSVPEAQSRPPAVAGSFYPADPGQLAALVDGLLEAALGQPGEMPAGGALLGLLVPHAGLVYSGLVAAAAWRLAPDARPSTVVLLGTNHVASWLNGVAAWPAGTWGTPLGDVAVDAGLAAEALALGDPFEADARAHEGEHSIEVQLPFVARLLPGVPVLPLAVGSGTGDRARAGGERLGQLLAGRRAAGERPLLVISTDMAHYPPASIARQVTDALSPSILAMDSAGLAAGEAAVRRSGARGVACGMCGIEPSVLGLAALRAAGATRAVLVASSTSADAGGDPGRTVGYLAVAFFAD